MKACLALSVALAFASTTTFPAPQEAARQNIFTADKMERVDDHTLRATGNVEFRDGDLALRADFIEVRDAPTAGATSVEIVAAGNVVLSRAQERMTFERLEFKPGTRSGAFQLPPAGK